MKRLSMLLMLAGCAGADAGRRWAGSVETLPNGAVRVANPAEGLWDTDSSWQLVPELSIGVEDGPEAEMFTAISGLQVDEAGRIYVLDRQTNELRIFAPDGAFVKAVGRSGGGPGEYSNANGLVWIAPDTLLVVDQRGGRYTLLDRQGEYVRSVPRQLPFYGWVFKGGYRDGRVYELFSVGTDEDRRPALIGTNLRDRGLAPTGGTAEEQAAGSDAPLVRMDTVLLPIPSGPQFESFSVRTERAGMSMSVPFAAAPVYHVDREGALWHGHGSEFRLVRSSFAGDTLREVALDAAPAPVDAAELEEWESGPAVARFKEMGGDLDMGRIPKAKPFFDDVFTDPDGYLWASVPAGPTEVVFAVFDSEGRYLGRLQASGVERSVFIPPVVRDGRLHFVGRDELDVQRVYVYRIEK